MDEKQKLDFLLGAVSPGGFTGYFDQVLAVKSGWRTLLIKAGPGCGKSTMMRRISDALVAAGETVELIHCSSDPDSLDGVICMGRKFCIVDATAPHTLEPRYPGASEEIVSLYDCLDRKKLHDAQSEVVELFTKCSTLQERAGRYITAAGSLLTDSMRIAAATANLPAAKAFAGHLALKYFPKNGNGGDEQLRLLSANTADGVLFYADTVKKLANTVIVLQDEFGAVSKTMLRTLHDAALARGHNVITCYCPFAPWDKIEHLILPELSLAFVTGNYFLSQPFEGARTIHCRRFCSKEMLAGYRSRLRWNRRAAEELLLQASALQKEAKANHDLLEKHYTGAADFAAIDRITEQVVASL